MPELPEVETIRRSLVSVVTGKQITDVTVLLPRMVRRQGTPHELIARARRRTVQRVRRRGKSLLCSLDSSDVLVFRLGMTGQLLWSHPDSLPDEDKHTHVIIYFDKGGRILFRDIRQFGEMYLVKKGALEKTLQMGAEPLQKSFTLEILTKLSSSTVKIKHLLMDQKKIAGIGNIYSDEILFEAGIHPLKPASALKSKELQRLHHAIGTILREAIACKGDTLSDYRTPFGEKGQYQHFHRVYQRGGETCRRCTSPIVRVKLSGRSCHFCPSCQKE